VKAVALEYKKRELREVGLPEPELDEGQVLFRVREVGICGADPDRPPQSEAPEQSP